MVHNSRVLVGHLHVMIIANSANVRRHKFNVAKLQSMIAVVLFLWSYDRLAFSIATWQCLESPVKKIVSVESRSSTHKTEVVIAPDIFQSLIRCIP
jgi:hypothetical protein